MTSRDDRALLHWVGLALAVFVTGLAVGVYLGFTGAGLWSVLALAAVMALAKAINRHVASERPVTQRIVRTAVNTPVLLLFAGAAYGLGSMIRLLVG